MNEEKQYLILRDCPIYKDGIVSWNHSFLKIDCEDVYECQVLIEENSGITHDGDIENLGKIYHVQLITKNFVVLSLLRTENYEEALGFKKAYTEIIDNIKQEVYNER